MKMKIFSKFSLVPAKYWAPDLCLGTYALERTQAAGLAVAAVVSRKPVVQETCSVDQSCVGGEATTQTRAEAVSGTFAVSETFVETAVGTAPCIGDLHPPSEAVVPTAYQGVCSTEGSDPKPSGAVGIGGGGAFGGCSHLVHVAAAAAPADGRINHSKKLQEMA